MPFIPNTDADRQAMLERIGVENFEELISNIPGELRFKQEFKLPEPLSELEIAREVHQKTRCDQGVSDAINFLGGGAYDHFIPAAIAPSTHASFPCISLTILFNFITSHINGIIWTSLLTKSTLYTFIFIKNMCFPMLHNQSLSWTKFNTYSTSFTKGSVNTNFFTNIII